MRWGLGAANGKMTVGLWVVWEGVLGSFSEKTAWVLCGDSLAGTTKKKTGSGIFVENWYQHVDAFNNIRSASGLGSVSPS